MQPMDEYEALSRDYKNKVFVLDAIDAVVYVEGELDEYFWRNVLKHVTPDKKYKFEFNSNPDTKDRTEYRSGRNECAKKRMPIIQCYLFIKGHSLIDLDATKTGRPKVLNNINDQLFKKHRKLTKSEGVKAEDYMEYLRNTLDYRCSQMQWLIADLKRKL